MIYTSSYKNCLVGNKVSISGDRGRIFDYQGLCFPALAPKMSFWKEWHRNIGNVEESENNYFYVKNYYELVLKNLDPNEIVKILGNDSILLCYEDNNEFCHRHIVAYWLELELGIIVPEIKVDEFGNITFLDHPVWIKDMLQKVIAEDKKNQNKIYTKKLTLKAEGM